MDINANTLASALDLNLRDARALHAGAEQLADLHILIDVVAVTLTLLCGVGEPARREVGRDAQPEAVRIDFLAHGQSFFSVVFLAAAFLAGAFFSGAASTGALAADLPALATLLCGAFATGAPSLTMTVM